jgi:hypothetical protein
MLISRKYSPCPASLEAKETEPPGSASRAHHGEWRELLLLIISDFNQASAFAANLCETRSKQLLLPCSINVEPWPRREVLRSLIIFSSRSHNHLLPNTAALTSALRTSYCPTPCCSQSRPRSFHSPHTHRRPDILFSGSPTPCSFRFPASSRQQHVGKPHLYELAAGDP